VLSLVNMEEKQYVIKLRELLMNSLDGSFKNILNKKNNKIAVAFSGGVDSCIVAKLLKDLGLDFVCYVVGMNGCKDFESAENASKELGLKLVKIELSKEEIEKDLPVQVKILYNLYKDHKEKIKPETPESKLDPVSVTSNFPLFLVEKHVKEKYVVSGLGADTLFGGFHKYLRFGEKESKKDIEKETKILLEFDYMEDVSTAKYHGKEIVMPFLDKMVAEFSNKLPYKFKIQNGERKYILRKLAEEIELDEASAIREKKSAQYGSGIMKVIKRLSKKQGLNVTEYIDKLRKEIEK
jgi:asparagine synthase (glutamine-hydrolysing)